MASLFMFRVFDPYSDSSVLPVVLCFLFLPFLFLTDEIFFTIPDLCSCTTFSRKSYFSSFEMVSITCVSVSADPPLIKPLLYKAPLSSFRLCRFFLASLWPSLPSSLLWGLGLCFNKALATKLRANNSVAVARALLASLEIFPTDSFSRDMVLTLLSGSITGS